MQLSPQLAYAGGTPAPQSLVPHVPSYTGQPVAEIHTVGSPPLLQLLLRSLCAAGTRLAGPGEFTLRAFLAGRIDLTQAEAVLGVIEAADRPTLNVALGQLAGGLARPLHGLRDRLLDLLAHVEAGFDFADEDLPFITQVELDRRLAEAERHVAGLVQQMASRGQPAHAVKVVLVGRPNTGKSSLWNRLAGHRAALVSDLPGTTRDYLIAELDLAGVKCQLIDTAGVRGEGREERGEGRGERQKEAITLPDCGPGEEGKCSCEIASVAESLAAGQRRTADVEVLCLDSTRPLDEWERSELQTGGTKSRIVVLTKCDAPRRTDCDCAALETSALEGQGIESLGGALREKALRRGWRSGRGGR